VSALQISPSVLGPDNSVTLQLPPNFPLSTTRFRIGLFEAGHNTRIADVQRDFVLRNGVFSTQITVQADPGRYEVRLVSNDRNRTPISEPAPLLVPGIDREPGWWLLNGSPFVESAEGNNVESPNAPLFIPGLKRDLSRRSKRPSGNIRVPSQSPLPWRLLALPSWSEMQRASFSFEALRAILSEQIAQARARGERNYLGFSLPARSVVRNATNEALVTRLRQVLQNVAPEAALVLDIDVSERPEAEISEAQQNLLPTSDYSGAALFDAVLLRFNEANAEEAAWAVKQLRRIAEEQPHYDLPLFIQSADHAATESDAQQTQQLWLDLWMGGATGFISAPQAVQSAIEPDTTAPNGGVTASLQRTIERNASLFVNSATLEDIGLLPAAGSASDEALILYNALHSARRIPLLAMLLRDNKARPESFFISAHEGISNVTIESLRTAATAGARIYIEGAPLLDEKGNPAPWRMSTLVGADVKKLPSDEGDIQSQPADMILEDGWMFGTGRGTRVPVQQNVVATVNAASSGTATRNAREQRGRDVLTGPRIAARLRDGTPALIVNPVGKGEVIWLPHRIVPIAARASYLIPSRAIPSAGASSGADAGAPTNTTSPDEIINIDRSSVQQRYYAAVAAYVQPSLVSIRGTNAQMSGAEAVRVALRRSPKGTLLLALFNASSRRAEVAAAVEGVAGVALDLTTEQTAGGEQSRFPSESTVSPWRRAAGNSLRSPAPAKPWSKSRNTRELRSTLAIAAAVV
jgi:hypothetical protein